MIYEKHFISDCRLPQEDETTFLTDKKVDAQLYAILMEYSIGEDGQTVTYKSSLPSQTEIAIKLKVSYNTYKNHLKYLLQEGYIEEVDGVKYIINTRKENIYLKVDTDTIRYLNNTVQKPVWKVYLYLGQRWSYKKGYVFTLQELGAHIGKKINNHSKNYEYMRDILECLVNNGLIKVESFFDGKTRRLRLVDFSFYHKKNTELH